MNLPARHYQSRAKYGNKKTESHGYLFDSKLEASCFNELFLLEKSGSIRDLKRQVHVPLVVNNRLICTWVVDFEFISENGLVWRDAKGVLTRDCAIKLKLAKALNPHVWIEIVGKKGIKVIK